MTAKVTPFPRRGYTGFSWEFNEDLVGVQRWARWGSTRGSWGFNDKPLKISGLQRHLINIGRRHKKGGLYEFLEMSATSHNGFLDTQMNDVQQRAA